MTCAGGSSSSWGVHSDEPTADDVFVLLVEEQLEDLERSPKPSLGFPARRDFGTRPTVDGCQVRVGHEPDEVAAKRLVQVPNDGRKAFLGSAAVFA